MNLTPVESSHVAAIGYLDDERVLLVRYHDGHLYAWLDVSAAQFASLMAAPSKGKALHAMRGTSILISRKEDANQIDNSGAGTVAHVKSGPLNTLDEDAGKCCAKTMKTFPPGDDIVAFTCVQCGLEFRPEMVGPVRHWRIVPQVVILR
jgi:hypothetical protein